MDEYHFPGIRRACLAVEVTSEDGDSAAALVAARSRMSVLLAEMCESARFGELSLCRQRAHNGEVVLLPVGIDEPRTVALLITWFAHSLRQANAAWEGPETRLRMAVHEGITMLAAGVFDGPAVRHVRRLLDALPLSAALSDRPAASLAVLVSDRIHADLGGFDRCLAPEGFTRVEVGGSVAGAPETCWLLIPDEII